MHTVYHIAEETGRLPETICDPAVFAHRVSEVINRLEVQERVQREEMAFAANLLENLRDASEDLDQRDFRLAAADRHVISLRAMFNERLSRLTCPLAPWLSALHAHQQEAEGNFVDMEAFKDEIRERFAELEKAKVDLQGEVAMLRSYTIRLKADLRAARLAHLNDLRTYISANTSKHQACSYG
jgi:chromosome segregation ATPase